MLKGHDMLVKAIVNDGADTVVSGGWDGRVIMWKASSGDMILGENWLYFIIINHSACSYWCHLATSIQISGEKVGACELGSGNYVNALALAGGEERTVFAGGKDGMLVKLKF